MKESLASSPEQQMATRHIEGVPDALQMNVIDSVVGMDATIKTEFDQQGEEKDIETYRSQRIDALLAERGITPSDDDQAKQEEYLLARSLYQEAMKHDQNTWLFLTEENGTRTPRDIVRGRLRAQYPVNTLRSERLNGTATPLTFSDMLQADDENLTTYVVDWPKPHEKSADALLPDEKLAKLVNGTNIDIDAFEANDLNKQLDGYAKLIAKRSRRVIERTKTGKDIEASGDELAWMIAGVASEMYAEKEAQGIEHDQIVADIDAFISLATEDTLQKIEEHRLAEYNKSRPYMRKVYDTWAKWSDEKGMLKGGRWKKSAIFAGGGAAVGLAAAPLIGALGAGVVTGAVAVAAGRNVTRNLANGFMKSRDKTYAQRQTEEMHNELRAIYEENDAKLAENKGDLASDKVLPRPEARNIALIEFVNQRSKEYRNRNRRRVLGGTAIAMSVGMLSATAADALTDYVSDHSFTGKNLGFGRLGNGLDVSLPTIDLPGLYEYDGNLPDIGGLPEVDGNSGIVDGQHIDKDIEGDGINNNRDPDMDDDGILNEDDPAPRNPDTPAQDEPNWDEFAREARWVEPGEGWYQTFDEMGIPENHWNDVLEMAGPDLKDQGWAYFDQSADEWRISQPGKLTPEVLRTIAEASKRDGFTIAA